MMSLLRACRLGVTLSVLATLTAAEVRGQAPPPAPTTPPTAQQLQAAEPEPPPAEPPPGYILAVEGSAVLERANTTGDAIAGMPLLVGDRLRSEGGRLEVKWAERSDLRLARYTEIDLLSNSMVRVPRGRLTVKLVTGPGQTAHDQLAIDAPGASVRFYTAGEYHIVVSGAETPQVELTVVRGSAQLASDRGQTLLAEGERSVVRDGSLPSAAEARLADAVEADPDAADAADRADRESTYDPTDDLAAFQRSSAGGAYQGTGYLPTELYGYETVLGQNGSWYSDATYGHVWYPRVAADWRPYYRGRWHHVPRYGWTWLGAERWSWPTHHYGRWGHGSRGWFWVPAKQWGPAWVSWAIAPNYVSWCPLGWDGRPVFGFYNFNSTVHVARGFDPWRGWTVMSSHNFGRGFDVHRNRIDHRVVVRERPAFITAWAPRHRPGSSLEERTRDPRGGPGRDYGDRDTGVRRIPEHPQRIRPSGAVPPGPGYSGYYPGGYREGAVPREESPYDRARRVMDRRVDSTSGGSAPANTTTPGTISPADRARGGAVPRHGVPVYRPQDNDGTRRGDSTPDNGSTVRPVMPYRAAPGMSRPPSSDDAPGISRPQRAPAARPDNDGGDGGRRSGGSTIRHGRPDSGSDRSGPPPSARERAEGSGSSRGDSGGRSAGSSGAGSSSGSSGRSAGSSEGSSRGQSGGAVRRHPR